MHNYRLGIFSRLFSMQFLNFLKKQLLSDLVFVYSVYFELWIRALRKLKFFIKMLLENFK